MPEGLTLREAAEKYPAFEKALGYVTEIRNFLLLQNYIETAEKYFQESPAYRREEDVPYKAPEDDRVFPLESILVNEFETDHEKNAPVAFVHDGYHANELARSLNALAVTIGRDIYFRHSAYNPASEEGRRLLTHELTHVAQYGEKRISSAVATEDLETEAVRGENRQRRGAIITVEINGKRFRFPESHREKVAGEVARGIGGWFLGMKAAVSGRDCVSFFSAFDGWLKGGLR